LEVDHPSTTPRMGKARHTTSSRKQQRFTVRYQRVDLNDELAESNAGGDARSTSS